MIMCGRKPDSQITFEEIVSKINQPELSAILAEVGQNSILRFQQELESETNNRLEDFVREFCDIATHRSWKAAQKWCKWSKDGIVLTPDHTRVYYRRGDTEIVLQEFAPQMRLMKFQSSLVNKKEDRSVYSYTLALPYVNFLFRFREGLYSDCFVSFCDRPLKTLFEVPLRPYLSNLNTNLALCLGNDFNEENLIKDDVNQQIAYVLNHFWQTVYNNELPDHYIANKLYFAQDDRLCDLESWQKASIENPFFVIEDVSWMPYTVFENGEEKNPSYDDIISDLVLNDRRDLQFQQEMYDDISGELAKTIKTIVFEQVEGNQFNIKSYHLDWFAEKLLAYLSKNQNEKKNVSNLYLPG